MLVERRVVGEMRFSHIITTGDGRYEPPHPLIRFVQTSPTYMLSLP